MGFVRVGAGGDGGFLKVVGRKMGGEKGKFREREGRGKREGRKLTVVVAENENKNGL